MSLSFSSSLVVLLLFIGIVLADILSKPSRDVSPLRKQQR